MHRAARPKFLSRRTVVSVSLGIVSESGVDERDRGGFAGCQKPPSIITTVIRKNCFSMSFAFISKKLEAVEAANREDVLPIDRLHALVTALLVAYDGADAQHTVQINELRLLPPARQAELKLMERELVRLFSDAIVAASPTLADTALIKPVTMSLFGMLNWAYLWFNSSGALSREDYANLVTKLIVDGTRGIVVDRSRGKRRLANRKTPSGSSM
jgi:hypothetical protein